MFEAERPKLVPSAGRFPASVSKTWLVRFDNNKYSVTASAVSIHAYAGRMSLPSISGRGETTYDPWHYVLVLARKPGALRSGAPFKDWLLPAAIERVRRKLAGAEDGNRTVGDRRMAQCQHSRREDVGWRRRITLGARYYNLRRII